MHTLTTIDPLIHPLHVPLRPLIKKTDMTTDFVKKLGLKKHNNGTSTGQKTLEGHKKFIQSHSPVDGEYIGSVSVTTAQQYEEVVATAQAAFAVWRRAPQTKRRTRRARFV
jgi:delta 1-pyrroline-5-carboxylate dehydrogenase